MSKSVAKNLILLSLCLLFSCRQDNSNKLNDYTVIDVINNFGKYQEISVSEFVSELEHIPLDTNDSCLIAGVRCLIVTPSHIFIQGYVGGSAPGLLLPGATRCFAFSRDGRFICEIGRVGQGPGEYQNMNGLFIDEKKQLLYIETYRTLLEYSWDGVFRRSINKPQAMNGDFISGVFFVRDNVFIGHIPNRRDNEMCKFNLFDITGQVFKSFDRHVKFERPGRGVSMYDNAMPPYSISEDIFVKEYANDTLFCLNEQNELIPQFVFDLGKYTYTAETGNKEVGQQMMMMDEIIIPHSLRPVIGTHNYVYFSVSVRNTNIPKPAWINERAQGFMILGIYDISNKKTRLLYQEDPIIRKEGLINDLDGGFSFWPKYYTSSNELVDVYQAHEMKEMLTEQYFAGHTIKNPQAHQKLKELLSNLDYEDNPVVVIAKLKK